MTARKTAIASIASHRIASTQDYLESAGEAIYGQYVFHEDAQREYLAKPIFKKLRSAIAGHEPFDPAIVDAVAHGVKEWATGVNATVKVKEDANAVGAAGFGCEGPRRHGARRSPLGPSRARVFRRRPRMAASRQRR